MGRVGWVGWGWWRFFHLHTCDMLRTWLFLHLHTCDMLRKSWGGLGVWGGDDDVRDTGFFDRLRRGCTVHADGNKAWKSESKRRSVKFASVSQNKMQFTKWHSKTRLTGTQALDKSGRIWKNIFPKACTVEASLIDASIPEWNSMCAATCGASTTETGGSSSDNCAKNTDKRKARVRMKFFFFRCFLLPI